MEDGQWHQYFQGQPTGRKEKYRIDTNSFSGTLADVGRKARWISQPVWKPIKWTVGGVKAVNEQADLSKERRDKEKLKKWTDKASSEVEQKNPRIWTDPKTKRKYNLDLFRPPGAKEHGYVWHQDNKGNLHIKTKEGKPVDKKLPPAQKGFLGFTRITNEQGEPVPLSETFSEPLKKDSLKL